MFKCNYTAIACVNNNNAIGKNGNLLYHIKADLENFKSLTTDNVVIMGRRTFESLPNKKPLPNRINIILTSDKEYYIEKDENFNGDVYIAHSFEEVDDLCYSEFEGKELFIIGGGMIYQEAFDLDIIDKIILTIVNDNEEGDTHFPTVTNEKFKVIFKTMSIRDHPNDYYYRYSILKRI